MRYLIGCCCSAIVGGLVALAWHDVSGPKHVDAQERGVDRPATRASFSMEENRSFAPTNLPDVYNGEGLTPDESVNVAVYEAVNKSVVNINTKSTHPALIAFEVHAEGTGSGSILDKLGHVVTNFHVIADANDVVATLHDGKQYDASFVGADPENDIAIIKIKAPPELLNPVALGDSSRLKVGMRCFAIGNPFGLERTLTTGVVSSLDRSLQIRGNRSVKQIIQIDAAINPGNSGGPLLDTHGRLIGINTAIASKTGQSAGVGFAIPVNLVGRVVPELIRHGKVIRPDIGVRLFETDKGLMVAQLQPNGPGEKAGLRGPKVTRKRTGPFVVERVDREAADVIVSVDGDEVKTQDDFLTAIERKHPTEQVIVTVVRDGRRANIPVTLGGPPEK
ncbi:MAG TPA: trypsin-like peptidase domain-containing protein [Planctomycetaceae bacterium]|nr:trypsin-like peptidase domain-containing protein [Planctomycetaceae bacterium]